MSSTSEGVSPGPTTGTTTFQDPVGDVEVGPGPDITAVTMAGDAGTVAITVEFAAQPPLASDTAAGYGDMLMIPITTSGPTPLAIVVGGHAATLSQHVVLRVCGDAADGCGRPAKPAELQEVGPAVISGSRVTITMRRDALGDPTALAFSVFAEREGENGQELSGDQAPDRNVWRWTLP